MLRTMASAGLAALLALGGANLSGAAGTSHTAAATTHKKAGELVKVDAAAKRLVLKETGKGGKTKEITFSLAEGSKVMKGDHAVSLADLKPGESVTVTFTKEGRARIAQRIDVATMAAPAGGAASSTTEPGVSN